MDLKTVAAMALDEYANEMDSDESVFMEDPVVFSSKKAKGKGRKPRKGFRIRSSRVYQDVKDALDGMKTLVFKVNINTPEYGKSLGLNIPDDAPDARLDDVDSNDEVIGFEDAQDDIGYAPMARQFDVGGSRMRCATPANKCRAQNPLTCRYHGLQVFKGDIEGMIARAFQAAGKQFNGNVKVEMTGLNGDDEGQNRAGVVTLNVEVTVPEEDQLLVKNAMEQFGRTPGVRVEAYGGDGLGDEAGANIDIDFDRLDQNQRARYRRDDLPEGGEGGGEEERQTQQSREEETAEAAEAQERPTENEHSESARGEGEGRQNRGGSDRDFDAEISALQGQIDAVGQKIATDDQNLQFLNGMVQNAPNDAMRQMAQGMVDQATAAKTEHEQERQRLDGQMVTLRQEKSDAEESARQAEEQWRREDAERAERDRQHGLLNLMAGEVRSFLDNATDPEIAEAERSHPGYSNGMRRLADLLRSGALNEMLGIGGGGNQGGLNDNGMNDFPTRDEFKRAVDHLREGQFAVTRRELEGVMRDLYNNENVDRANDEDDVQFAEEVMEALPEGNPVRVAMKRALDRYNEANRPTRGDDGSRSQQNDNGQRTETIAESTPQTATQSGQTGGEMTASTEEEREEEPQPIGFSNGRQIYPEGSSGQYVRNGTGGWSELRVNPFTGEVMREEDLDDEEYSALHEASMTPTDTISREEFERSRRRDDHSSERSGEVGRGDGQANAMTSSGHSSSVANATTVAAPSTPVEHAAATVQAREAEVERPAAPVASAYTAAGDGNSAKATAQVTDEMRNPLVAEFERAAAEKSRLFAALRERGVDANDRADGDAMKARRYSSYLGSLSHLIGRNGSRLEGKNAGQILEDAQNWVRESHGADRTLSDGTVQRGRETTKYKRAKDAARFIGSKLGANVSFDDETGNMSVEWTDRPEAVSVNFDYIQGVNPNGAAGGTGGATSVQAPQQAAAAEGPSANETARSETRPQNTATAATPAFEARNERAGRLNSALQNVRGERARNLLTRIRDRANA